LPYWALRGHISIQRLCSERFAGDEVVDGADDHGYELRGEGAGDEADHHGFAALVHFAAAVFGDQEFEQEAESEGEGHAHALMAAEENKDDGVQWPPRIFEASESNGEGNEGGDDEGGEVFGAWRHGGEVFEARAVGGDFFQTLGFEFDDGFDGVREGVDG